MRSSVPDHVLAEALSRYATQRQACGICGGTIDSSINLQYDRICIECGTKYDVVGYAEGGGDEYEVVLRTTPLRRLARKIEQRAATRAAMEELAADQEDGDAG